MEDFVRQGRAFQSQKRLEVQCMFSFFSVPRGSSEVRIASARRLEIRIGASEAAAAAGIGIRETESEKRERSGREGGKTSPKLILMLSSRRPKRA